MARRRRTFSSCSCFSAFFLLDLGCFQERTSFVISNFAQSRRRRFTDSKPGVSLLGSDAEPSDHKTYGESLVVVASDPGSFQIWQVCSSTAAIFLYFVDRDLFSEHIRRLFRHIQCLPPHNLRRHRFGLDLVAGDSGISQIWRVHLPTSAILRFFPSFADSRSAPNDQRLAPNEPIPATVSFSDQETLMRSRRNHRQPLGSRKGKTEPAETLIAQMGSSLGLGLTTPGPLKVLSRPMSATWPRSVYSYFLTKPNLKMSLLFAENGRRLQFHKLLTSLVGIDKNHLITLEEDTLSAINCFKLSKKLVLQSSSLIERTFVWFQKSLLRYHLRTLLPQDRRLGSDLNSQEQPDYKLCVEFLNLHGQQLHVREDPPALLWLVIHQIALQEVISATPTTPGLPCDLLQDVRSGFVRAKQQTGALSTVWSLAPTTPGLPCDLLQDVRLGFVCAQETLSPPSLPKRGTLPSIFMSKMSSKSLVKLTNLMSVEENSLKTVSTTGLRVLGCIYNSPDDLSNFLKFVSLSLSYACCNVAIRDWSFMAFYFVIGLIE